MILYFSGTGNSRFTASLIAKETDDVLVSLNDLIRKHDTHELSSAKPFVFVVPTYAARIPRIVSSFITAAKFSGNRNAYFVMTAFQSIGCAERYNKKICKAAGLNYAGTTAILMAENYVAMYDIPSQQEAEQQAQQAVPAIMAAAHDIAAGKVIAPPKNTTSDAMMSTVVNPLFYRLFVHAGGFHASDACIGCGACVENCPLGNIVLADKKPTWGKNCTHCMACICRCPQKAIEYKNATQNRERFFIEG